MNDFPFLNIIHKVKFLFSPLFSSNIADLAENVRLEGPKKQAISLLKRAKKTGNYSPVAGLITKRDS